MGGGRGDRGGKSRDDGYSGGKSRDNYSGGNARDDGYSSGKGSRDGKGEKGDRKGEKGDRKGEKGKGGEKGKNRASRPVLMTGVRGQVVKLIQGKPSGFLKRGDGREQDVFFDFEDILDGATLELWDVVEFDIVEGSDSRPYGARIKQLPKHTPPQDASSSLKTSTPVAASKTGSLTGSLTGSISLGPSSGSRLGGALTGGLSLRPGGGLSGGLSGGLGGLRPGGAGGALGPSLSGGAGGALGAGASGGGGALGGGGGGAGKDDSDEDWDGADEDGLMWGRVVSTKQGFGFLTRLGSAASDAQLFFRAGDVVGMNSNDPGPPGKGLEITLPHGRNSNGFKSFWLNVDDEVSFIEAKDHRGDPRAIDVRKERKGAWRTGRRQGRSSKKNSFQDQWQRLLDMDPEQVLHNASLFKEVLGSQEFRDRPSYLQSIVSILAAKELVEDDRADSLYRIFLDSTAMQTALRTTILKHSSGKHSGDFLEECLRCLVECVLRHPSPQDLRGHLPLVELVEAWEASIREGSTATKKGGVPPEVKSMFETLQKKFPDEINLSRVLGVRQKKTILSAAEDYSELLEADDYQDMPILPTSEEMLGKSAFEIQENMRTYQKCEDYIQTHFMLLREDYVEPLRAGIQLFFEGRHSPKDLHVYTGMKVIGLLAAPGVVYRVELQKSQTRRINWDKTRQLMYGNLLCFSDDNFQTVMWATIWRRDPDLLREKGHLDIKLPFEPYDDRMEPGKTFCCIENTTTYFEAVRHVLIALQNMRPTDVPFQSILLSPQPDSLPPGFLKAGADMFHFHNVFQSCEKADAPVSAPKTFNVLQEWPSTLQEALDIDPSQLDAIRHALTHAVALIQGPPGTGKTWVGLKIVQALLDNTRGLRHSPILVVCYTNHALDQFLEGIFKFCERMARIGSRSKSEIMKTRNLKELVSEMPLSPEFRQARKAVMERRDRLRKELEKVLNTVNRRTLDVHSAREILGDKGFEQFYESYLVYLGDDAKKVTDAYEDADAVDEELWTKMLKAFLETSNFEKLAPVLPKKSSGGLPKFDDDESDSDIDRKTKEIADDAEEEEAEEEEHERKLDMEVTEPKRPGTFELHIELPNAWMPQWEDYEETMKPELRSFVWQDEVDRLWLLPREFKHEAYRQWMLQMHFEARELLPELARQLERNADSKTALDRDRQLELLREMEIVGMTTTAVSKNQDLLKALRPEVIVVEEAAQVLEAHILAALHPRTQHIILIGDHQQLRPATTVYRISKHFHLDVSLFERLIHNRADHVTLLQQRRMHPKISRLIRPYYPELRDHASTYQRAEVMGVRQRTFFLKHGHLEDCDGLNHSKTNTFEAHFVSALCAHLIKSGHDESQITVLSPYLGQVRFLKEKLRRDPNTAGVMCMAVDNYQGEENDIIILSLVRSNRDKQLGFVSVDNRINVAITRARCAMYIIGNADMLAGNKLWSAIIDELQSDESFGDRMPLLEYTTGGVFEVKSSDDISCLLEDPLYETGGEGETIGGFEFDRKGGGRGGRVADRWAELDKDRGRGGYSNSGGYGYGGAGYGGSGAGYGGSGAGYGGGSSPKDDRPKGGGQKGSRTGKGYESSARNTCDSYSDSRTPNMGSRSGGGGVRAKPCAGGTQRGVKSGGGGAGSDDEEERPRAPPAPPPTTMEASGDHPECELIRSKDADEEVDNTGKKAGKKNKGGGNKVVVRWG